MKKKEKIHNMKKLGYEIIIKEDKENDTKIVTFISKYTEPEEHTVSYSKIYTDDEIRRDLVDDMMKLFKMSIFKEIQHMY